MLPLFFPQGCLFRSCSSPTTKNGPIRINQLRIAISVNLFFLYSCKMMGGWGHASYPRSSVPRPYPLSFHIFAHSSALFCTWKNPNSHVFRRFRTLRQKTGGRVPPLQLGQYQQVPCLEIITRDLLQHLSFCIFYILHTLWCHGPILSDLLSVVSTLFSSPRWVYPCKG